jgi:hypothetical protein
MMTQLSPVEDSKRGGSASSFIEISHNPEAVWLDVGAYSPRWLTGFTV